MTAHTPPLVRVELHKSDGSKVILEGESLKCWLAANDAVAGLWASRGWGDAGFGKAFELAQKIPAPEVAT